MGYVVGQSVGLFKEVTLSWHLGDLKRSGDGVPGGGGHGGVRTLQQE